jgi:hypothetical protein
MNTLFRVLFLLSVVSAATAYGTEDPTAAVTRAIRKGNAKEIGRYFNNMVDLSIPGFKDNYSKTQAERILQDFFDKNKVSSFSISRQGNSSDGSRFSIGTLEAGNARFRVFFLYRNTNGAYLIFQFQIQAE